MSVISGNNYHQQSKQGIVRLAAVLKDEFPWVFFEDVFENLIDEEKARTRESGLSFKDKNERLQKLHRIKRRLIAFTESIQAFVNDAAEICKPTHGPIARIDDEVIVFDLEQPYEITADQITCVEDVKRWAAHLRAKSWTSDESILSFVRCVNQLKGWSYAIPEGEVQS